MPSDPPRKRDAQATRARILQAAQHAFAVTGYSHTGIREIATLAGTSSTLLLRYYGSKAGLFEAALREAIRIDDLIALPPEDMARTLARTLREEEHAARPMLMMAMASGEPEAAHIAARVFTECSIVPMGAHLASTDGGGADGEVRALELAMLAIGYVFFTGHLPLPPRDAAEIAAIDAWFTRQVLDIVRPG
ncbi:TetR/AcrR family transcriptional regulator [Novosphingobium kaempferiae]|uniref:TetR/AcrR family transcriptional regulator n=1 Tax=Novosphingobium kaempferiae TaxID=2896849 RepID=UPI001E420ED4|nr:TetR/AcrR family transcriptional regulator [Novosphingobium kaempferiae]